MKRLQLIELEDLPWFPSEIRNGATACLRAIGKMGRMGNFMAPPLAKALKQTQHTQLLDLCSGGAGPLPEVLDSLQSQGLCMNVLLTDKYPNTAALRRAAQACSGQKGLVSFFPHSVDATKVPHELSGFRTLFNAFHHFPPHLAQGILADAVQQNVPIAIFEVVERRPWAFLAVIFSPIVAMFLMVGIRPVQARWWLFTFVLPVIPALLLWDGLVSCLRVYSQAELSELIHSIKGNESFDWQYERIWMWPMPMRCQILIGVPKA